MGMEEDDRSSLLVVSCLPVVSHPKWTRVLVRRMLVSFCGLAFGTIGFLYTRSIALLTSLAQRVRMIIYQLLSRAHASRARTRWLDNHW